MKYMDKLKTRYAAYQPNKKSLYKAVVFTGLWTMGLGFTLGGWTTQGGAQELAHESRVNYAAALCAERFLAADFTGQRLATLKEVAGRHQRRSALEKGGNWLTVPEGTSVEFAREAALACADRLFGPVDEHGQPIETT